MKALSREGSAFIVEYGNPPGSAEMVERAMRAEGSKGSGATRRGAGQVAWWGSSWAGCAWITAWTLKRASDHLARNKTQFETR